MTLTYPVLSRSRRAIWLVTGSGKRRALEQLIAGDRSIPGARLSVVDQIVVTDLALDAAREEP